jgi:hypothetical protein
VIRISPSLDACSPRIVVAHRSSDFQQPALGYCPGKYRCDLYNRSFEGLIFSRSKHLSPAESPKSMLTPFSGAKHSTRTGSGALCTGADGPRPGAGRYAAWCLGSLPDGRTVRVLGPDGPHVSRGRRRSPVVPGSRSREGPRRGGEILGDV